MAPVGKSLVAGCAWVGSMVRYFIFACWELVVQVNYFTVGFGGVELIVDAVIVMAMTTATAVPVLLLYSLSSAKRIK